MSFDEDFDESLELEPINSKTPATKTPSARK